MRRYENIIVITTAAAAFVLGYFVFEYIAALTGRTLEGWTGLFVAFAALGCSTLGAIIGFNVHDWLSWRIETRDLR